MDPGFPPAIPNNQGPLNKSTRARRRLCGMGCAKGDEGNATAKGQSSVFRRKMRPRSGMRAPKQHIISRSRHPPLPDPRFAGPSGDAFGRHSVTLLGIVAQATTCVVRLVFIPILSVTRSAEDSFRGALEKYFILYPNISCATVHTPDESNLYHSFQVNQERSLQGLGCSGMQYNYLLHIVVNATSSPGLDALRYVSCRGGQKQELSCPVVS